MLKKLSIFMLIFILSCTSSSGDSEIKEVDQIVSQTTEKLEAKPVVSLQEIGFESMLPDIVYQNYLVLKDIEYVREKSEIRGYKIIGDDFILAPGEELYDKFSINLSGGRALMLEKDDILFVIFRSTTGDRNDLTRNVLTDLDGSLTTPNWINEENILLHSGFDKEYNRFRNVIKEQIKKNNPNKIIFTGHSLGSALASLLALDASMYSGYDVSLLTLGAPRVGNSEFRKLMDEYVRDNYRIFFPEDPIANIPGVLFDYEHTGIALGIGTDGNHNHDISIDNFGFTPYRSIFDDRFDIHKYPSYFKAINKILRNCYADNSKCFDMKKGYMTMMVERETMNQYRLAVKAKPDEALDQAINSLNEEKDKLEKISKEALDKTNMELSETLDGIIQANKAKTEWAKSYKEKAQSLSDLAKQKAKDLISK